MAVVSLLNTKGEQVGSLTLEASLFDVKMNPALIHEAVVAQQANSREAIAHTKTRGEVAGSSKKPWKQKGTGRARHGSTKSPIWVGGGITFGPRNERNFSLKINKRAKRKALAMILSEKVSSERFVAVDVLDLKDGKTKELAMILKNLPISKKKTLIVLPPAQKDVAIAAKNMKGIETMPSNTLNVVDLLKADVVLISKEAIDMITQTYKRA
ncbi:50S ribosomal protein L4 [Candidatus Uhrbacteria bacterium RIFOXYB2_FULL_45_11]|uniref:Large ribosomal subunit protein uL4 n=2 Tax=Candidatus Uhriibacteriota TaxID=1752732 RepID=A0A1F7W9K2_9BACT|nr:MAG: 50S ribosomal protein L4 [Candidatus Uhrbacteria bacterium RIFCSPHIGHO2_01_FULL_47_10]OGL70958.1 MAG: 50S ribosomal protein L4 [Candidatus Uhrbacteria bacterium RIFCSPHIGHO2_02_FULL_47_44]OGL76950.1 MAG: 50S ribosomal protein L4 [Candidatus Uhrbacteria bacterium RIFCSPHIGHO2_12_FULL_47_12]OGL80717.1 MAG: 50S ribosomal protein L4 [Candidatus Uhrbacteria bacterium RIFCSPLOWO2_01_FULL_47_17]OGL86631.1 MAG: 50S ribosomal protein L4 [Candidatus Uhrbacteria bacterium RIFCSPLOWO2_02_FULL_48_18